MVLDFNFLRHGLEDVQFAKTGGIIYVSFGVAEFTCLFLAWCHAHPYLCRGAMHLLNLRSGAVD